MMSKKLLLALILCSFGYFCQGSFRGDIHGQLLEIRLSDVEVEDFVYLPTPEGYRFSYKLSDGRAHEEVANIVDPNSPAAAAYIMSEKARRAMPRPRSGKNRKLSPKSLQSLAG